MLVASYYMLPFYNFFLSNLNYFKPYSIFKTTRFVLTYLFITYSGRGSSVMSLKKIKVEDDSDDLTRDLEDPVSEPNISEVNVNLSQVKTGMFFNHM